MEPNLEEETQQDLGLPSFSRIEKARKELPSEAILSAISERSPSFSGKIQQLSEEGFNSDTILDAIQDGRRRGAKADVAVQVPVQGTAGVLTAPTAAARGAQFIGNLLTDPKNTVREFLGFERFPEEKPILEQIIGPEKFQRFKEATGIKAAEDFLTNIATPYQGMATGFTDLPAIAEQPDRRELIDLIEEASGIPLSAQTPEGRIAGEFSGRLGEAAPLAPLTGPAAALSFATGGAASQTARELGAPDWLANPLDLAISLAHPKPPEIVEYKIPQTKASKLREAQFNEALSKQRQTEINLQQRDVTKRKASNLTKSVNPISENENLSPGSLERYSVKDRIKRPEISIEPITDEALLNTIVNENLPELLNQVEPIKRTREQALNHIRDGIQRQYILDRSETSNLYNRVSEMVGSNSVDMYPLLEQMGAFYQDLEEMGLPRSSAQQIRSFLMEQANLFEDAEALKLAAEESGEPANLFDGNGRISVNDAIRLKQNLNNFIDFEFPDLEAKRKFKNLIRPVVSTARETLNSQIRNLNREAFVEWRKAERSHAQNVEKYGKDVIIKIQRGESPLKVLGNVTDPAEFEFMKNSLEIKGRNNSFAPEYSALERLVLEEQNAKKTTSATKRTFEDFKRKMSSQAVDALELIEAKNSDLTNASTRRTIKQGILKSVLQSAETGELPSFAITTGQTPKGLSLVQETLRTTQEGRNALKAVEQAITNSIYDQFTTQDGLVDLKKLKRTLENRDLVTVLKRTGGNEAFQNLKNVEGLIKESNQSMKRIFEEKAFREKIRKSKEGIRLPERAQEKPSLRQAIEEFGANPRKWLSDNWRDFGLALSLLKVLGISVPVAGVAGGALLVSKILPRLLRRPKTIKLIKFLKANPRSLPAVLAELNREVQDELQN